MSKKQPNSLLTSQYYLDAALKHGEYSEPDHEVGDLQDFFRVAWSLMTPEQRKEFALHDAVHSTLEATFFDDDEEAHEKLVAKLERAKS